VTVAAAELKACCAAAYASPAAAWLLGTRFHPGGSALTERLIRALVVGPGDTVADVACGPGESSLQVARATGARAIGVDLSADAIAAARRAAARAGFAGSVEFLLADAEALPLEPGAVDGVLCECSLCTFPNKERAAAELARVLRPGGRLALSDMIAEQERLPASLRTVDAWVACLADARPLAGLVALLAGAGLVAEVVERHDDALARLLDRVDAQLRLARTGLASDGDSGLIERGIELVAVAQESLELGILGYAVVVARRPAGHPDATMDQMAASNLV
jgi:SAM-dependent methyltransferase